MEKKNLKKQRSLSFLLNGYYQTSYINYQDKGYNENEKKLSFFLVNIWSYQEIDVILNSILLQIRY